MNQVDAAHLDDELLTILGQSFNKIFTFWGVCHHYTQYTNAHNTPTNNTTPHHTHNTHNNSLDLKRNMDQNWMRLSISHYIACLSIAATRHTASVSSISCIATSGQHLQKVSNSSLLFSRQVLYNIYHIHRHS